MSITLCDFFHFCANSPNVNKIYLQYSLFVIKFEQKNNQKEVSMKDFKNIVLELRKEKNWSQETMAKKLNVSKSTVAMWEAGERNPLRNKMEEIADLFNVDMDYIFGKTDIKRKVSFDNTGNTYASIPEYSYEMIEMIDLFSKLNEEQKKNVLSLLRSFNENK